MYEKQTYSHQMRYFDKVFSNENLGSEIYKKHFRKTYAGKPIKRYSKLIKKNSIGKETPIDSIEQLFTAKNSLIFDLRYKCVTKAK